MDFELPELTLCLARLLGPFGVVVVLRKFFHISDLDLVFPVFSLGEKGRIIYFGVVLRFVHIVEIFRPS